MNKTVPLVVVAAVVFGVGGFFGGSTYAQAKAGGARGQRGGMPNFQNLTAEQRQQFQAAGGTRRGAGAPGGTARIGGGFVMGEVLKMDDKSLTISLPDGGSRIIFVTDKTQVQKTAEAILTDIKAGMSVRVAGASNDDGSVSAQSVQIVPAMSKPPTEVKK